MSTLWLTDQDEGTDGPEPVYDRVCEWPIIGCCDVTEPFPPEVIEWSTQAAIEILYAASGRQFGICTTTIQPCDPGCVDDGMRDMYALISRGGRMLASSLWFGGGACRCGRKRCECKHAARVVLPSYRVREILDVTIDGTILDTSAYRLQGRELVRTDGGTWPRCQDPAVEPGMPGTWTVTYKHGRPVPVAGQLATGKYQCELAKACGGDDECELPQRVKQITRQETTVAFIDPMDFLDKNRTGIYTVDAWLQSVNPAGRSRRARFYSAGMPTRGRRVGTAPVTMPWYGVGDGGNQNSYGGY